MFELVIKDGNPVVTEEVKLALTEYRAKELTIEEMKDDMKELNDIVMEYLLDAGRKTISIEDSEGVTHTFTYKAPTQRVSADVSKMKADGIFEEYSKTSQVKESMLHTMK